MKFKIALFFCIVILSVFLIYLTTLNKDITYVSLGDFLSVGVSSNGEDYGYSDYVNSYLKENHKVSLYTKDFSSGNARTTDLLRDIKENKSIIINKKARSLKNILIKADLLTVSVGMNDILSVMETENIDNIYDYLDTILVDMEEFFSVLRQYCKEDIIFIGFYNPYYGNKFYDSCISYMNTKASYLAEKYNINYVDIYSFFNEHLEFLPVIGDIHPSVDGYKSMFDLIKPVIEKTIFK